MLRSGDHSSHFVEEDGHLSLVVEHVVLGFVADVRAEAPPYHAVPVAAILLVELLLDVLRHEELHLQVVHRVLSLTSTPLYLLHRQRDHVRTLSHIDDALLPWPLAHL